MDIKLLSYYVPYILFFMITIYPAALFIRILWEKVLEEKRKFDTVLQNRSNFTIKNPLFIIYYSKLLDVIKRVNPSYNIFYNVPLRTYGYKSSEKAHYVIVNNKSVPVLFVFIKNPPRAFKHFTHDFIVLQSLKDIQKIEKYLNRWSKTGESMMTEAVRSA